MLLTPRAAPPSHDAQCLRAQSPRSSQRCRAALPHRSCAQSVLCELQSNPQREPMFQFTCVPRNTRIFGQ
eukprot:4650580-Pleurochrysis_carterae.AAC.2